MSEKIVISKYNNNKQPASSYLWVYSQCCCDDIENDQEEQTEELAFNHPPVLDWQSGLENLKEHQIEPVEQHKIEEKPEESEESCDIVVIEEPQEQELISIQQVLDKMLLSEESQLLQRFLTTKSSTLLLDTIDALQYKDPVSFYQLRKIAGNLKKL